MNKATHPMATRILTGVGLMALATLAVTASIVPGGALEGRATSLRVDEPATTTTTAPAPAETPVIETPPAAEPAPAVTTTTIAPAVAPVTTIPTVISAEPKVELNVSGHYTCFNMDAGTQYAPGPDCKADVTADPGPNNSSPNADPALPNGADGDQPGHTLGSTDDAYGADLTAKSCEIKPWLCGDSWTPLTGDDDDRHD